MVRRAERLHRAADARRVRRRRQGRRLPRQRHAGRPRWRRGAWDLGSVARRAMSCRASMRGSTPVLRCCPRSRETTAGLRAALFVDQVDAAWFPREGYSARRDRVCRDGLARLRSELQPAAGRRRGASRAGARIRSISVSKAAHRSAPICRPTSSSRSAVRCACRPTAERVFRPAVRIRTTDVLQPHDSAAGLLGTRVSMSARSAEVGRISDRVDGLPSPGTVWSSSVFLGADTFIGPLYFGVGVGAGRWSLYLLLGAP